MSGTVRIQSAAMKQCLKYLAEHTRADGEMCSAFAPIARHTGLPQPQVRRAARALARRGLAQFYKALTTEDGDFAGAGYCITHAGMEAYEARLPLSHTEFGRAWGDDA